MVNPSSGTCCFAFSNKTGATLIGIICCVVFIKYLILAITHEEFTLYFIVNTVLYGIVGLCFLKHRLASD